MSAPEDWPNRRRWPLGTKAIAVLLVVAVVGTMVAGAIQALL